MRTFVGSLLMGVALLTALNCNADVKVDEQVMAPTGWIGATVSAHGVHVAVLAMKGSRNVVLIADYPGFVCTAASFRRRWYAFPARPSAS